VAPGDIATEGVTGGSTGMTPAQLDTMLEPFIETIEMIPMKRMGGPDDIAKVALILATPIARYMTGAEIVVDGGRLLR
jgi:2-dehydro-3-deoxy-D-gluconate 5-dehydrogenase